MSSDACKFPVAATSGMKSGGVVKLTMPDGSTAELPVLLGTAGPPMIDIRALYAKVSRDGNGGVVVVATSG